MVGVMKPDEGNVSLNNQDTLNNSTKNKIGYMPDSLRLYDGLSVYESMKLISDYKFKGKYADYIHKILFDFNLWERRNTKIVNLSMGLRKKLAISMAFLGDSQLLVLHEPTNGLDTAGIIKLKDYIIAAKKNDCIVVVSSHVLDFISTICDKNVFLSKGEKLTVESNSTNLEDVYRRLYIMNA